MDNLWIWLVVEPTPLNNMSSSSGMMTFPIYGQVEFMFQTTNQLRLNKTTHTFWLCQKIAIENGHWNSGFMWIFPFKWVGKGVTFYWGPHHAPSKVLSPLASDCGRAPWRLQAVATWRSRGSFVWDPYFNGHIVWAHYYCIWCLVSSTIWYLWFL